MMMILHDPTPSDEASWNLDAPALRRSGFHPVPLDRHRMVPDLEVEYLQEFHPKAYLELATRFVFRC